MVTFKNIAVATNLKAWYAARLQPVVADGTAADSWTDFSGNGTAITGTTTARPLYKTNIINGLPAYLFDGTNDRMTFTSTSLTQNKAGLTAYVVWKRAAGTGATQQLIAFLNSASNTRYGISINTGASFDQMFVGARRTTETAVSASTSHLDTQFHVCAGVANYATDLLSLYVDNSLKQTAVIGGTSGANSQNSASGATDTVGSIGTTTYLNGYIAEIIFCDAAHSGEEVADIMATLRRIYGGLPQ